jgi:hypothetical protein
VLIWPPGALLLLGLEAAEKALFDYSNTKGAAMAYAMAFLIHCALFLP